jgi:hypothetical protein
MANCGDTEIAMENVVAQESENEGIAGYGRVGFDVAVSIDDRRRDHLRADGNRKNH